MESASVTARGYLVLLREHPGLVGSAVLLAAVRTPLATLAILLALPVVWQIVELDNWLSARAAWYRRLYVTDALWRFARSPTPMAL